MNEDRGEPVPGMMTTYVHKLPLVAVVRSLMLMLHRVCVCCMRIGVLEDRPK